MSKDRQQQSDAIVEATKALHADDFKKGLALAKKLGQALMKLLPTGFNLTLPPTKLSALQGSYVLFDQPIMIDNKTVASVKAYFRIKRAAYSDEQTLGDPEWTLNMWIPRQDHVYPASSVSSGAAVPGLAQVKKLLALPANPITADKLISALGGPKVGRQTGPVTMESVKRFVMSKKGWLDLEEETPTSLFLSTRENGDVGDEMAGREDLELARNLAREVVAEFGRDAVRVEVEAVDEWVHLNVKLARA
jgi:hypothetical protein